MPKLREGAFGDRFEVRRQLGTGGFGDVYEVMDLRRLDLVAVKVLHQRSASTLIRFKNEFRHLARLSHPHLVQLYELLNHDEDWLFTMELIRGEHFLSYIRGVETHCEARSREFGSVSMEDIDTVDALHGSGTVPRPNATAMPALDIDRLRDATSQLAEGVHALHNAGKLHCDLKPPNVIVSEAGRVVILDFGMVAELTPHHRQVISNAPPGRAVPILGTPLYMSPEQSGLSRVTAASDWYSLGVMLHEAMRGDYPVDGDTLVQLLLRKSTTAAPKAESFPAGCPPDLVELCCRLLEPESSARPLGAEVLRVLGTNEVRIWSEGANLGEGRPFVGRVEQLEALEHALFDVRHSGTPQVVNLSGPSGIGKTCVVNEFLDRIASRVMVLEGKCYENESVPYKAVDGVIDQLAESLRYEVSPSSIQLVEGDLDALVRVFPVLRRIPAIADIVVPDDLTDYMADSSLTRRAAIATLGSLLRELGTSRDIVVFIDDVQWGDLDSADLLNELFRAPSAPRMLLITTHRDNEGSEFLDAFKSGLRENQIDTRSLVLSEFGAGEAGTLISELLGDDVSEASVERIWREAKGSPFFIDTLARHSRSGPVDVEHSLSDVIGQRVGRLPEDARKMLEVIALSGQPLERQIAREAAYIDEETPKVIALLRNERLITIRIHGERQSFETYHDRIRETVRDRLPEDRRRRHHLRLGQLLERCDKLDSERLAVHFKAGGWGEKAADYSLIAAKQAEELLAFDHAARLYRDALNLKPGRPVAEQREIWVRLGHVYSDSARGTESADAFLAAAEYSDEMSRVDLTSKAAEQMIRSGQFERGQALLYEVLGRVQAPTPKTDGAAIRGIIAKRVTLWWRGTGFELRDAALADAQATRLDTLWAATNLMGTIDVKLGAFYQLIHLLEALDTGAPEPIARGMAMQAVHASTAKRSRHKARVLLETSLELAESQRLPPSSTSWIEFCRGMVHYMSGSFREGYEYFLASERTIVDEAVGLAWELANVRFYSLFCLLPMGKFLLFNQAMETMLDNAELANDFMHLSGLRLWSYVGHLTNDDPATALLEAEQGIVSWTKRGYHLQHFWYLLARANTALYEGDGKRAYAVVESDWPDLRRSLLLETQVAHIIALETRARACIAAAVAGDTKRLSEAARHTQKIEKLGEKWATGIVSLLRAEIAVKKGRAEVNELLAQADVQCSASNMTHWSSAARYRLGLILGGARGERICAEAFVSLEEEGVVDPHRMFRMLTPTLGDSVG